MESSRSVDEGQEGQVAGALDGLLELLLALGGEARALPVLDLALGGQTPLEQLEVLVVDLLGGRDAEVQTALGAALLDAHGLCLLLVGALGEHGHALLFHALGLDLLLAAGPFVRAGTALAALL